VKINVWDVLPWSPRLFYGLAMQGVLVVSLPVASMPRPPRYSSPNTPARNSAGVSPTE
jgi:hypothetical protein